MNAILEQINSAGLVFVRFTLPMLVQSSVLIVVLLLVDLLLRKKVRAVVRYWLWMLVIIKLVLPTTLSSPVSLGSWFGDELADIKVSNTSIAEQPVNLPQIIETKTIVVTGIPHPDVRPTMISPSIAEPVVAAKPPVSLAPLTWQGTVFLVWAAVVTAMGLLLLQRAIFVTGLVAQAQNPTQLMNDAFGFCCGQMGLKSKVGLKVSASTASPAVCGLFRTVILVPQNLAPTLGSSHLRPVLLHELAHIKRGDLWINLVQTILQIVYFYNPLLWLANSIIRRIREQAVDEAVQVSMGTNAPQYPQTLVDVAKIAFNRPVLSLRLIGVVESKSALKGRIERMLNRPIPKSAKLGILGLIALLIFAAVLLPMAKAKSKPPEFIIKGTVTDAHTGRPVAGAKVGDEQYAGGKQCTTTDANGYYSYSTWYEEHNIKCEAPGYKTQNKLLYTKLFGSEKEKVFDFALEPSDSSENIDYSSVTVKEGVGFYDIIVGDQNCTGEFIKSKLGKPDKEIKDEMDWWLDYGKTCGLEFWIDQDKNMLIEIRLDKGFKSKLTSGISMSSTKLDVFDVYGQPIQKEEVEDLAFTKHISDRVLFKKSNTSKIYYTTKGLLFWFDGDAINQIVVFPKSNPPLIEHKKQPPSDINAKKKEILEKLVVLNEQRDRVQRELDVTERALGEVRDRYQIYDLEESPHPIVERLNRLQKEQDDCTLEISQLRARMENLKRDSQTEQEKKELKDTENHLVELQAKFEALEKMRKDAAAQKQELDLACIQYKQRAAVRDERMQMFNVLKSQIEKFRLMYENPAAFDTLAEVEDKSNAATGTIDIVAEDFTIRPYPAGGLYTVTVAIRNKGSQEAPSFRLNFYQGDPANNLNLHGKLQTGWNGAGPIKPGDVWNESSSPFALKEGLNEIAVVLDTNQSIAESDETNNRALMRVVVKEGQLIENSVSYSPHQKAESPGPKTNVQVDTKGAGKVTDKDKMASENLAAQGWELWQQGKFSESEKAFEKAVSKDPTNANAWNGLGWAQQNQSKPLNAKASFEKCLEIQPKHDAALNGLGWIAKAQGKTDEAIAHWERAIEVNPAATASLNGLATTYMELKQFDKSAKYYKMWLKVEPNNTDAKTGMAKAKLEKTSQTNSSPEQNNPVVSVYPPSGSKMALISELQVVFDQPMMPEKFKIVDASLEEKFQDFSDVAAVHSYIVYDAEKYQFSIPLILPCNWNGSVQLCGFKTAKGVEVQPIVLNYTTSKDKFSDDLMQMFEKAKQSKELRTLLENVKNAHSGLKSLSETVYYAYDFGDHEKSVKAIFKMQGSRQFYVDMSEEFEIPWHIGSDGEKCWFYNEHMDTNKLVAIDFNQIAEKKISICDPFEIAEADIDTVIKHNNIEYLGTEILDGRKCHKVRSWLVKIEHKAACSIITWWFDSETYMPAKIISDSGRWRESFRFVYDRVNEPINDSEFRPESVTKIKPQEPEPLDENYNTRYIRIIDGSSSGRMSIRWGKRGPKGTSGSGLN
jgi:beta-lactamase regulating signal transducer with metallopeptidase domain/tetratricopeptide (TPR) repeat protein/outer membrane lipoprotein-sorting protein